VTRPLAIGQIRQLRDDSGKLGRDWVEVLRDVPIFSGLSKRHLRQIADSARGQRFERGSQLVRKGERGETFFVLLDGKATVLIGRGQKRTLGPGDFFGELALLDGGPRSATVTAETDLLALRISRRRFLALVESDPKLAAGLLKGFAARLRAANAAPGD
jgi:CRP-like cAMP-binding protein